MRAMYASRPAQRRRGPVALVALLVLLSPAWAAEPPERTHDITVDDYLTVHLITDCAVSADGKQVAYTELRWADRDEPRATHLWVVGTQDPRPQRLTFEQTSHGSPQWSPDGQYLYFTTRRKRGDKKPPYDGSTQVWRMTTQPAQSAEPFPVTRVKGGVQAYQLSKDGRTLYYTRAGEEAKLEWKELRKKYGDIKFGDGAVQYTELWKLDLQSWREEQVVAPQRVITEFQVAPNGSRIALVTTPDDRLITKEGQSRMDVFDATTRETATLPDQLWRADAPTPYGWLENPVWSSDGRYLAFAVSFDGYPTEIIVADWDQPAPRVRKLFRPEEVTVNGPLQWRFDSYTIYFLGEQRARRRVCGLAVGDQPPTAVEVLTPGDVVVQRFDFSSDGKMLGLIRADTTMVGDVYCQPATKPTSTPQRLTNMNPQVDAWKLPQISLVTWQAPDGVEVEGILELPPDYAPDQGALPLVVELHGGPTDATLFYLRYWIYGRTLFAAKGYALLSPNYRGSTGYGDKFMTDLIGRENDIEVQDILAGVDAMIERGIADPQRLGVMGWSNGGFLVNCLITTTQRFKAASTGAGVLDQFMQWGLEDTPGHVINYMRGLPWERTEAYVKASPGYKLGDVTTPTLIHVGENDDRVPAAHSRALYRGLKEYTNVPTVLLVYPGAGHGLSISDHRKGKLDWDVAWFDRYLLGKKDQEPVAPPMSEEATPSPE